MFWGGGLHAFVARHANQMSLLRTAAREKFDTSLSGMRVSPDVGKQMGDAVQVCPTDRLHVL